METKNIISITLGLVVTVILIATLLVPIVQDAQNNAGEKVYYPNGNLYGYHLGDSTETATITFNSTDGWKYNGNAITTDGLTIVTDFVSVKIGTSGDQGVITSPDGTWDIRRSWSNSPATIEFNDGNITLTAGAGGSEHHEWTYTWMLQPKENGEWQTKSGLYTVYANSINDVLAVGYYSTGDNDTAYQFKDGVLTVVGDYTTDATYNKVKVAGTTDVYQISGLSLQVGDESFSPWFVLVKSNIVGHQDSGPAYSIYGVIPLVVIVSLLVFATGTIYRSRSETL